MYKILLVAVSLMPLALATGYEQPKYGHQEQHGYEKSYEEHYPPQPYKFGYDVKDGYGGTLNQKEEGDSYGNKKGSYGYTDAYGVYRQVEYVADKHGFRANVKTNEPGTANQNPADVYIHSSASPTHYESGHYKSASHDAPSYAPSTAKVAAPLYKAQGESYSAPKTFYKSQLYNDGPVAVQYGAPVYADIY